MAWLEFVPVGIVAIMATIVLWIIFRKSAD